MLPNEISRRLREEFGLDESVFRGAGLAAILRQRMEATGVYELDDYLDRLTAFREEFLAFADLMLVPESWFFRDRKPFAWRVSWARETWTPQHPGEPLRILSVPCAGGQEPYSIAIALLAANVAPQSFHIEAGDLSERFLEEAREAVYRQIAFRGGLNPEHAAFFEDAGDGLRRVAPVARQRVTFRRRNLLGADFANGEPPFHVIFCRNVLIYFNGDSRKRALDHLLRVLAEGGVIFAGHADALGAISPELRSVGPPGAFCFRPSPSEAPAPAPPPIRVARVVRERPRLKPTIPKDPGVPQWTQVRALADSGRLAEAESVCRALMEDQPTADGFAVLGEILVGQRRHREAESCFRRAVYLDSRHATALFYLALMAERRGDLAGAERFRKRARAAESSTEMTV